MISWKNIQFSQAGPAGSGGGGGGGGTTSFNTNSGTATPAAGVITIDGGTNINTSGAGSTVTINLDNIVSLTHADNGSTQGYFQFNGVNFMHNYGAQNTFVGQLAGNNTLTVASAVGNVAVGMQAMPAITTGGLNTCVGNGAGISLTSGRQNTALGQGALGSVTDSNTTALGFNAFAAYAPNVGGMSGTLSCAVGFDCMQSCVNGAGITAFGGECGQNITSAVQCTLIGAQCCDLSTSIGDGNICIGYQTARGSTLGANNLIIGNGAAGNYTSSEANNILFNSAGVSADANTIRLGIQGSGAGQQNKCFVAGITGVSVGSVADVVAINTATGQLGTTTLTAGTNITLTPAAGTITITASSGSSWTNISGSSATLASNNNYYVTYTGGTASLAMPLTITAGSVIKVSDATGISGGSGGFTLSFDATQALQFYNNSDFSFPGTPFSVSVGADSISAGGYVEILCIVSNTTFVLVGSAGNISIS
jgi:hypothetical protein